eukprot:TRINITY_DN5536_c0_g1_i4.p1 TRINITY_DN5536_c0_g1~~TRINITY_DN5536_c0_g1_i4.p1  ORF type:complete len:321 (+),score=34.47 TRINITY_DN5536_c0_g1_i4:138-1100(+)
MSIVLKHDLAVCPSSLASTSSAALRRRQRRYRVAFLAGVWCVRGGAPGLEIGDASKARSYCGVVGSILQGSKDDTSFSFGKAGDESVRKSDALPSRRTDIRVMLENMPNENSGMKRYVFCRAATCSSSEAPVAMEPEARDSEEQEQQDESNRQEARCSAGMTSAELGLAFPSSLNEIQSVLKMMPNEDTRQMRYVFRRMAVVSDLANPGAAVVAEDDEDAVTSLGMWERPSVEGEATLDTVYEIVAALSDCVLRASGWTKSTNKWIPLASVYEAATARGLTGTLAEEAIRDWCSLGILSIDEVNARVCFIVEPVSPIQLQ